MRPRSISLTLALVLIAQPLFAQATSAPTKTSNFAIGQTMLGPSIGLGGLGSAGMSLGGRFEHGFKALPDFGNGTLGIGVQFDYYSYSYTYTGGTWGYKYMPFGVTANYHFPMTDKKFDPYIGLGLGYSVVSVTGGGTASSDIYWIGALGGRYFINDKMAVQADVGTGVATLNLGLMFRM